jgi:hypothetical protein
MELRAEEISQIIKEQITDYDKEVELSGHGPGACRVSGGNPGTGIKP